MMKIKMENPKKSKRENLKVKKENNNNNNNNNHSIEREYLEFCFILRIVLVSILYVCVWA